MAIELKINRISGLRRLWSAWRGKKRNKEMLEQLTRRNLELWPAERIQLWLGLDEDDVASLRSLAELREGWHDFAYPSAPVAGNYDRLASIGLIRLKWPSRKIYLTDAGRFFLSLTAAERPLAAETKTNEDQ